MRSVVCAVVLLLMASKVSAEWLSVEIGAYAHRLTCATSGKVGGANSLIVCGAEGSLHELRWLGGRWIQNEFESGLPRPDSAAFADINEDGSPSLLIGSRSDARIIEHSLLSSGEGGRRTLSTPGLATWNLTFSPKTSQSSSAVLVKRIIELKSQPLSECFVDNRQEYYSCRKLYDRWGCDLFGPACVETPAVNPPAWNAGGDIILAGKAFLRKDGRWIARASLPLALNVQPSRKTPRRVYLDREIVDFSPDFSTASVVSNGSAFSGKMFMIRGPTDELGGVYRSMAVSLGEGPNTEIVLAADGEYIHRIAATSKGWRNERVFKLAGDVQRLISADLRGDGIERVYIIENIKNAQKGHVLELTYFPRRPRVSIATLVLKSQGSRDDESRLLSDLISQELVDTNVIQVVEEDQQEEVEWERAFNAGMCEDDACRAKFIQVRKSDYLVVPTIVRDKERTSVQITLFDSHGVARKEIRKEMESGEGLVEAVRRSAKELVRAWSELPRL